MIEIVVYRIPPASITCKRVDIFVNSWTAPKGPVCETEPALPIFFNSKGEECKLGCVLWCWARCCLDSGGRAEIGRLIWCRLWNWKWLPNHTIETSYESSLKWLFHERGCWSLNVSRHITFSANFPDRWKLPRHWDWHRWMSIRKVSVDDRWTDGWVW